MTAEIIQFPILSERDFLPPNEIPSKVQLNWLRTSNENGLLAEGLMPYVPVGISTKRACEWRGWAVCTRITEWTFRWHITDRGRKVLQMMEAFDA